MSLQTEIMLAYLLKDMIFEGLRYITEVESKNGINIMPREELDRIHEEAMKKRDFQSDAKENINI